MYTNHAEVEKIAKTAFPNYNGKKFQVKIAKSIDVRSEWCGGSRDFFVFVNLNTLDTMPIHQQSGFDKPINGAENVQLVPGLVCVEHTYFQGKDMGITIHVHVENAPRLLPENKKELTREEKIVLTFTRIYKNSYAGETNCRFKNAQRVTGITSIQWESTKQGLIEKKLINKAGAITNDGRNAIEDLHEYSFK